MTSTLFSPSVFGSRWFGGMLAIFCLCFLSNESATATTSPIYINNGNNSYFQPSIPFPQIDATAFVNPNIFSVTYNTFQYNQITACEPWFNTLFYTNTGELILNAPFPTGTTFGQFNTLTTGVAYYFDLQSETNSHLMSGTFYNPGTIHCNSLLDGNNSDLFEIELAALGISQFSSIGCCFVTATNIINPGFIRISDGGELDLNGQKVDLTRANLTVEQGLFTNVVNVNTTINSEGEGFNTNGYNPFTELTANQAIASPPDNLVLNFPASYFNRVDTSPTSYVYRVVFIVNANTNIQSTVYMAPQDFGSDGALVQWAGTYTDPLTGLTDTNYLYLFHYYFNSTNFPPILATGVNPQNFGITFNNFLWGQSAPIPGLPAPSTPGFQNIFTPGNVTNMYEFFNATLGVSTNASGQNPNGSVTNLPNQVVINASRELKMPLAQITGPDYMSIMAPNQFDGSPGAQIATPFADLNLGVTNGYPLPLTVSNLLQAAIPQFGGTLNEWSTRWLGQDANSNLVDFRVLLVYANLEPTTAPQVQNLTLTASNLVISDVLNVFGSAFANAQSLTLTTNNPGARATSLDGELNLQQMPPTGWSWNGSFPYLSWLTNDGAIRLPNNADFISSAPATNAVPTIPSVQATNILFEAGGANVASLSTVSVGGSTYTFTNTITTSKMASAFTVNVKVGATFDASLSNLIAAINFGTGAGTVYTANGTLPNQTVTAGSLLKGIDGTTNHGFIVTANSTYSGTNATLGDFIPTSTTATNLTWALGDSLSGAVDEIPGTTNIVSSQAPYGAIINNSLISDQGATLWVSNFMNGGIFTNGSGSFGLTSVTATMTNGFLFAGGDVSLTANTLEVSNLNLQAGRSLTLQVTNFLTDDGVSNQNLWAIDTANGTGFNGMGLVLPFLPTNTTPGLNNLLGTTISMVSPPPNQQVSSTWAGLDYGASTLGFTTNNVAIGQLILNTTVPNSGAFYFTGPSGSTTSNAMYVDLLVLSNFTSLAFSEGTTVIPTLQFNNNMTIYYADAVASGDLNGGPVEDVAYLINGFNGGHLQWIPQYVGHFSGTNMPYSNGSVNQLNFGLVSDPRLASNGSGTNNINSPAPIFVRSQIGFQQARISSSLEKITWNSVPGATNIVQYATTNWSDWITYTNFVSPLSSATWPITNIIYVPIPLNPATPHCWFRVRIDQDNSILYPQ